MVLPTYARTLDFWREFWIQKIKDPKTFWIQDQGQEVRKPLGSKRCENLGKPLGSKDTKNLLDPKDTPPPPPTHIVRIRRIIRRIRYRCCRRRRG